MRDLLAEEKRREKKRDDAGGEEKSKTAPSGGSAKKKSEERREVEREGRALSLFRPPLLLFPHSSTLLKQHPETHPLRLPLPLCLALYLRDEIKQKQNTKNKTTARPNVAPRRASIAARAAAKGDPNQKMMWEALREAVDEEMERDPTVCLMGEDVGHYGGSYKVTYDLYKKYGDLRLLDTPICENGFMGVGIGAAMTGLRVIIEGMNMGFLLLAYNQISNNAGMLHYTSGGQFKVPVVIRGPGGVGRQLGAEHSQRLESYFQSIPGVQLVACSTAANAKALLKSAIRSDNPVSLLFRCLFFGSFRGGKDEREKER